MQPPLVHSLSCQVKDHRLNNWDYWFALNHKLCLDCIPHDFVGTTCMLAPVVLHMKIKVTTHLAALINPSARSPNWAMEHETQLPMWTIKLPQLPDLLIMLIVSPLKCLNCSLMTFANDLQTLEYPSRQSLHTWQNSHHKLPTFFPFILLPPPPPPPFSVLSCYSHSSNHYLQAP